MLYLWGLGESGCANSFYSAAVQAGSESWKAFFFGSSDSSSSITVDKTPLALWPMALSVRLFGLSSWSILVPQALMGVATVELLHQVVRRSTGSAVAGPIAGTVMALTPVAVLMFRFNTPTRCSRCSWSAPQQPLAGRSRPPRHTCLPIPPAGSRSAGLWSVSRS